MSDVSKVKSNYVFYKKYHLGLFLQAIEDQKRYENER